MEAPDKEPVLTSEEKQEKKAKKREKKVIQLERTRTAFERLQLAWIRTTLTLLMIGVGAYEYFYNRLEQGKAPLLKTVSGRDLGLFLILTSFVMLFWATIQHRRNTALLKKQYPEMQYSVALVLSYLMLALSFILSYMVLIDL
jgi:uncharacterized membrane protein YidH (DUF202 family)